MPGIGPARPADRIIMKTYCVRMLLLAAVLGLLSGCRSAQIYATRAAQMREPKAPRLQSIMASEQPALVVYLPKYCGWGQQVGTVWVEEAISGRTVWQASEFMRAGSTHYFIPEGLESGTYLAILRDGDEAVAVTNFDVH